MIDLSGHQALITGSTKGVGRSMAESIARAGADVLIHGRKLNGNAQVVLDNCRAVGGKAEMVTGDLSRPTEVSMAELFQQAIELMPDLDILVNNAGTYIDRPFLEMDFATYAHTMNLNVASGFFLTQAFARLWIEQGVAGRVLFTGSINGILAEPTHTCYDTSKGAVASMVRTLCVALAPYKIRVNGVAPGLVRTPLTSILDEDQVLDDWMKLHTPNGQVPDADVCGDAAAFMVSDSAEHIHGQMLLVDGGMSAWQQPDPPR